MGLKPTCKWKTQNANVHFTFLRECWHEIVVSVSSFGHLSSHFLVPEIGHFCAILKHLFISRKCFFGNYSYFEFVVSFTVKSVILQQQLCPNLKVEKTVLELDFTVEALF